ncbi:MAG: hypothetical protein IRZ16_19740 [Myxococcaceae bacterium]|nr:hypothetical protein [Myxococcaceae bacterium]
MAPTPPAVASTTPQHRTPKPQPPPTPASPAVTPAAPQPAVDVDALIEELNVLRRRGQFADAAARLERALAQPLPDATSERLSYELGSILTWQLRDTARACKVWKQHQNAHPAGRYAAEIERAEQSLGCQ